MVMEPPSPQCVGREFVRQYYTVLNKAPTLLHRFYSKNSSFVHGGLDHPGAESKPVIGQVEIHQKILQLNFTDCHAKIRQVDSHETLEQGVVVQVTGELSNNGQPMRRFMQTFVLAPQTPKQFYVRNDIFRYQDEVFNDDDDTDNQESTIGTDDQTQQLTTDNQDLVAKTIQYYDTKDVVRNGTSHLSESELTNLAPMVSTATPELTCPSVRETASSKSDYEDSVDDEEGEDEDDEEELEEPEPTKHKIVLDTHELTNSIHSTMEPKTYANMVSKNTPTGFTANTNTGGPTVPPAFGQCTSLIHNQLPVATSTGTKPDAPFTKLEPTSPTTPLVVPAVSNADSTPPESDSGSTNANNTSNNNSGNNSSGGGQGFGMHYQHHGHFQQNHRGMRMNRGMNNGMRNNNRFENRDSFSNSGGLGGTGNSFINRLDETSNDGEKRKPQYPDSQQLFVGNLPHTIGEEELKKIFDQFGTVVDARINTKPNMKTGPGGKGQVPNFGFVVFEDSEAVQKALSQKPVHYNNHRLNVEEKKTKARMGGNLDGGNRIVSSGRGGMMQRGGMNNNRGGRGGGMQGIGRGDSRGGGRGGGGGNIRR